MPIDPSIPLRAVAPAYNPNDSLNTAMGVAKLAYLPKQMKQESELNDAKLKAAKIEAAAAQNDEQLKLLSAATPENYGQVRKIAMEKYGEGAASMLPEVYDKTAIDNLAMSRLDIKDKLSLLQKEQDMRFEQEKFGETKRHNRATEGISAENADIRSQMADLKLEAAKRLADGEVPMKDRVAIEKTLRDDFQSQSKDWQTVADYYARGQDAYKQGMAGNPAGDISLVFSYMKMLDPTSVVREGEYATAANAAGVPDRVRAMYSKALSGEQLAPAQRKNLLDGLEGAFATKAKQQQTNEKKYDEIAKRTKADPQNVRIGVAGVNDISPTFGQAPKPAIQLTPKGQAALQSLESNPKAIAIREQVQAGKLTPDQARAQLKALQ